MPPTRTEPTPGPDEASAAAPASAETPPAASGPGIKAWLPLALTILIMPVLAYAMTSFVVLPKIQQGLGLIPSGKPQDEFKKVVPETKKESVTMNKLLVNVAGTMGSRYLLVSLTMVGSSSDLKTKIQEMEPQMRDAACGTLATKTLVDLEKPGARNLIRNELLTAFNAVLGSELVQEIYLTEFAIQ